MKSFYTCRFLFTFLGLLGCCLPLRAAGAGRFVNAPANLTVTPASTRSVVLTWTDQSADETGFQVERKLGAGGVYVPVGNVGANVTRYKDSPLVPGATYFYRVRASHGTDPAAYSNEVSILLPDPAIPEEVKVSREGREPGEPTQLQYLIDALTEGTPYPVFPTCDGGNHFVGWQLYYDPSGLNTQGDWTASLQITLLQGTTQLTEIWTKDLHVDLASQTSLTTIFHPTAIPCSDAYKFQITRKTLTGPVPAAKVYLKQLRYLRNEITFNPAEVLTTEYTYTAPEVRLNWTWQLPSTGKGVLAYDVEWVYIANGQPLPTTPQAAFETREPVRITTAALSYTHPLLYPDGNVWFRVRAVGYDPADPSHQILGTWQYVPANGPGGSLAVANPELNRTWQLQTTFAEEGKYKKLMSYYDGSSRLRQTLTNLSTEKRTLVAEQLYDFEGRKALDVLPTPLDGSSLTYKPNLNAFAGTHSDPLVQQNTSATRNKFHYDNGTRQNSVMANTSGASQYYSANNSLLPPTPNKNYLPAANGYVYAQTEYTPDNTGRVVKQSGVGEVFSTDGDPATGINRTNRAYFGSAAPAELTRLFGSNVGNASHYKKNMMVDPNGQVSVTYQDQEGRTVATALAGEKPANLDELESYTNRVKTPIAVDVTGKNRKSEGMSRLEHKILNTAYGTRYTFRYELSALAAQLQTAGCQNCSFDLRVVVTSPTGALLDLSGLPGNQSAGDKSYQRKNLTAADCANPAQLQNLTFELTFTELGDYTIVKEVIPRELTFEEAKNLLTQQPGIQEKMTQIRDSYTVDLSQCTICRESCAGAEDEILAAITEIAGLDCENIRRQIIEELRQTKPPQEEVTEDEIKRHPLYCKYELCNKNQASDVFDKQLSLVTDWTTAEAKGYGGLLDLDPFFNVAGLSGTGEKTNMQNRLSNILVATIPYDTNGDGRPDGNTPFRGTLQAVTDPNNTAFYVGSNGRPDPVNGRHLLYWELMGQRGTMSEAAYNQKINEQRWTLFRNLYLENKRQTKLVTFAVCPRYLEELNKTNPNYQSEADIEAWGRENYVTGPVSDQQLEMTLSLILTNCGGQVSVEDQVTIKGRLRSYFDNPLFPNFFRLIISEHLLTSDDLKEVNRILGGYNCSLAPVAVSDPLLCKTPTTIRIPRYVYTGGDPGPQPTPQPPPGPQPQPGPQPGPQPIATARLGQMDASGQSLMAVQDTSRPLKDDYLETLKGRKNKDEEKKKLSEEFRKDFEEKVKTSLEEKRKAGRKERLKAEKQKAVVAKGKKSSGTRLSALSAPLPAPSLPSQAVYNALLDFYNATNGPGWHNNTGWRDAVPGQVRDIRGWYGVTLDAAGNLVALDLEYNGLEGSIPASFGNLSSLVYLNLADNWLQGEISTSISNLTSLATLDLRYNDFTGEISSITGTFPGLSYLDLSSSGLYGPIPASIDNLTNLTYLSLDASGEIPASIGNLTNLNELHLYGYELTGELPASIGNLTNLTSLGLFRTGLTGTLPASIGNLSNLTELFLSNNNNLAGPLPSSIGNLGKLTDLYLTANSNLTGEIPATIGNLTNLLYLGISNNNFTGAIPSSIGGLTSLKELYFSNSGTTGEIPASIGNLTNLTTLFLYGNHNLTSAIPASIGGLTSLTDLYLSNTPLSGEIPASIGNLINLRYLQISGTELTGAIPSSIGNLSSLDDLRITSNQFTGALPASIGNLTNLTSLFILDEKGLTGVLPSSIGNLINLGSLYIVETSITGEIPASIGSLAKLYTLQLAGNKLTGTIPATVGNLTNLVFFLIHQNLITGEIPASIGNLTRLYEINLSENALTGAIPSSIGSMTRLTYLNMANNNLTGVIPSSIGNLQYLLVVRLGNNNLTGPIPAEFGQLPSLSILDLQSNQLSGTIPAALASARALDALLLQNNQLSGSIPAALGSLSRLYSLYLSSNQLSGSIPVELGQLRDLVYFYVDNNQLSGPVPTELDQIVFYGQIRLQNNRFTFSDLLPFLNASARLDLYSPQALVGASDTIGVAPGSSVSLTAGVDRATTPASQFRWFKYVDGVNDTPLLPGYSTDGHTYTLATVSEANYGTYYYQITNDAASQLVLRSQSVVIGPPRITYQDVTFCQEYETDPLLNPTLGQFNFQVDWGTLVQECEKRQAEITTFLEDFAIERMLEEEATAYYESSRTNCLQNLSEKLSYTYENKEYHYTLYYYDQAGNLVQTVPPKGVKPLTAGQTEPAHELLTTYRYNTYNKLVWQRTPDAGITEFWYDAKGQLRLSRNAQQALDGTYSYTRYDAQGRLIEVGELTTSEAPGQLATKLDDAAFPQSTSYALGDITRTHYDLEAPPPPDGTERFVQTNLRNRVSWVEAINGSGENAATVATYYSYDEHGNVKSLQQQLPNAAPKRTDYAYDLILGKINYAMYQYGEEDQLMHRYSYDADNRLQQVYTSTDGFVWDKDAEHFYYAHGPLARVVTGHHNVQGSDYYYTLQGWLKGVNMPYAGDPGQDGGGPLGLRTGRDAFSFVLGYYSRDYQPINGSVVLSDTRDKLWTRYAEQAGNNAGGLYNGNIAWMVTDLPEVGAKQNDRTRGMQGMVYRYDQLNRITAGLSLSRYSAANGFEARAANAEAAFDTRYSYDPNGNLSRLTRRDDLNALSDDLTYSYFDETNRLRTALLRTTGDGSERVYSSGAVAFDGRRYGRIVLQGPAFVASGSAVSLQPLEKAILRTGFTVQGGGSLTLEVVEGTTLQDQYAYDAIGNLTQDRGEGTTIEWTVYGKIRSVTRGTMRISFRYDAAGNRVEKQLLQDGLSTTTRYVRDASGNVMATYELVAPAEATAAREQAILIEQPLYGSTRLGLYKGGRLEGQRRLGYKQYELSNHLGNVLAVVTDNIYHDATNTWAKTVSTSDYYPFGFAMPGRSFNSDNYRYGFNSKEKDPEFQNHYDYGFRIYNPRLGKFLSVDPLTREYPELTPYQFASNTPIAAIDLDGLEARISTYRAQSDLVLKRPTSATVSNFIQAIEGTRLTGAEPMRFATGRSWDSFAQFVNAPWRTELFSMYKGAYAEAMVAYMQAKDLDGNLLIVRGFKEYTKSWLTGDSRINYYIQPQFAYYTGATGQGADILHDIRVKKGETFYHEFHSPIDGGAYTDEFGPGDYDFVYEVKAYTSHDRTTEGMLDALDQTIKLAMTHEASYSHFVIVFDRQAWLDGYNNASPSDQLKIREKFEHLKQYNGHLNLVKGLTENAENGLIDLVNEIRSNSGHKTFHPIRR